MVMDLVFSLRDGIHSEFDAYGMECIFLIRWSASLPMPQISYETEESVLSFEHQDIGLYVTPLPEERMKTWTLKTLQYRMKIVSRLLNKD